MRIRLSNVGEIIDMGNGEVELNIPEKKLTPEQDKMISELFPHCEMQICDLLATEALISSIVSNPDPRFGHAVTRVYENPEVWKKYQEQVVQAEPIPVVKRSK
jgi:hypothetical protein